MCVIKLKDLRWFFLLLIRAVPCGPGYGACRDKGREALFAPPLKLSWYTVAVASSPAKGRRAVVLT